MKEGPNTYIMKSYADKKKEKKTKSHATLLRIYANQVVDVHLFSNNAQISV